MTIRPPRDPQRLSATQLAELALCDVRVADRLRRGGKGLADVPLDTAVQQARAIGVLAHAQFHERVSLHHNQALEAPRPAPTVENTRGDDSRGDDTRIVVAQGQPTGSTYCFIATHIYGPDHPRTWQLRRFRERCLRPHPFGRWLVIRYYRTAPAITRWLQCHRWAQVLTHTALDGLCVLLTPWTKEHRNGHPVLRTHPLH